MEKRVRAHTSFCFICFTLILFVSSFVTCGAAPDWPQWRGPNRDGKSLDTGLLKEWPAGGPELVWKRSEIGTGFSSPMVADGRIYITGKKDDRLVITVFDLDGKEKWSKVHGPAWKKNVPGARGSTTIDGKYMYLMSGRGLLVCYSSKTGEKIWDVDVTEKFGGSPPHWGYAESVLIHKNLAVVTPGGKNCIVALNKKTGEKVWASSGLSDPAGYSSCIYFVHEGFPMISVLTAKGMVAVDARNGKFLWRNNRAAGRTAVIPTPVYSQGYVFGASGYGNGGACVKLDVSGSGKVTAKQVWDTKEMVCHHGGYVVVDGYIYGNHSRGWNCLDLKTGELMWSGRGVGKGSVSYADGMLYTFGENGGRIALVPAVPGGFSVKGKFRVKGKGPSWAHPVITDGRLYLRYHENLYVFDVKA